jgi:hypothetical protein
MLMRRSGWDVLDASWLLVSLMKAGMSMLVVRAKREKMRLAREPRRTASSIIRAWSADEFSLASSGAASAMVSILSLEL